jgi:CHAD domain-containing protein
MENLKEYFTKNLVTYRDTFFQLYSATISDFSEKNVHDLRVSIRRLLAFSNLIGQLGTSKYSDFLRKDLKKLLKSLNDLRDTQVQLIKLSGYDFEIPDLTFLIDKFKSDEIRLVALALNSLTNLNLIEIEGIILFITLKVKEMPEEKLNLKILEIILTSASNQLNDKFQQVDVNNLDTVHSLRIALKKYRYLTEILSKPLAISKEKLNTFKKQQTILGEIQDNNVLISKLEILIENDLKDNPFEMKFLTTTLYNERIKILKNLEKSLSKIKEL